MDIQKLTQDYLPQISGPLMKILMVLAILIIGWMIAKFVARMFRKVLKRMGLDRKLAAYGDIKAEKPISKLIYYILMVIVLMVILDIMGVQNVLDPLKEMVGKFTGYLPNIIGAGIIGYVGFILAKIVSSIVGAGGTVVEKYAEKAGVSNSEGMLNVLKKVVFIFVFVPILIVALQTLNMESISGPATDMFAKFLDAIPNIVAAVLILVIFFYIGKFISNMIKELLFNMNADTLPARIGLNNVVGNKFSLSKIVKNVVFFFIMFTAINIAMEKLEFTQISDILSNLMVMTGKIVFGLVILVIGNYIATLAKSSITNNNVVANIVYFALLGLFLAMGLRSMGIADDIVNLAFGLILGSAAVAFALAFGLGGREAAGKEMADWFKKMKEKN
jgi:hypothetical protein